MSRLGSSLHESLTDDILKLLFSKKIFTTTNFIDSDTKTLAKLTSLSFREIINIQKAIKNKYSARITSGAKLYENFLKYSAILPTGIKSLDAVLGGGLLTGSIYELSGPAGSGKTQLCLTTALNLAQNLETTTVYVDTKSDFSAKRLHEILQARNTPEDAQGRILDRIKVARPSNRHDLLNTLYALKNPPSNTKLIIVDSLPAIFYASGDFNVTLGHLNCFVNVLRRLCEEFSMSALVTNVMLANVAEGNPRTGLGQYWGKVPDVRIETGGFEVRVVKDTRRKIGQVGGFVVGDDGCG